MHIEHELTLDQLPRECIEDCSAPGQVDEAVAYWREALTFTVDRINAVKCLTEYGAWSRADLEAESDEELAEQVLWLACGDFHEFIVLAEDAGVDPLNPPDRFETNCGSDIFFLG